LHYNAKILDFGMAPRSNELPKTGFAVEIDGRIKAEFNTREGAENGAIELNRRFSRAPNSPL
jgi:hypothetical protein